MSGLEPEERVLEWVDKNDFIGYCYICYALEYQPHGSICSASDYTEKVNIYNINRLGILRDVYFTFLNYQKDLEKE